MNFGDATPPAAMGEYTGFLLNWVAARSRAAFAEAVAEIGLRPPQFLALTVIAGNPGLSQQELVAGTGIDPSTMVATLDALEQAGLAERRPHAGDRRKRELHLTPAGERKLAAGREVGARVTEEILGPLSGAERDQLNAMLRRLVGLEP
jgi:DNA-binding MarR family transcriptional regulator